MFTFANNILIINKNNVTIMGILFFICIIAVIAIYCLLKPSKQSPTPPISSTTPTNPPIKPTTPTETKEKLIGPFSKTWTLTEFSREFGSMQYSNHQVNYNTGTIFTSCKFIKNGNTTYVNFHKSLGVLTKEEILQKKKDLRVGLNMNDKYVLFIEKAGKLENVDLNIQDYE